MKDLWVRRDALFDPAGTTSPRPKEEARERAALPGRGRVRPAGRAVQWWTVATSSSLPAPWQTRQASVFTSAVLRAS